MAMIKSLFGEDETTENKDVAIDLKKSKSSSANSILPDDEIESVEDIKAAILSEVQSQSNPNSANPVEPFEIDRPIGLPRAEAITAEDFENVISPDETLVRKAARLEKELLAIEEEIGKEASDFEKEKVKTAGVTKSAEMKSDPVSDESGAAKIHISQKPFTPESAGETARKSGLAFSAGISLFASVLFMLVLGWFVDLYVGSSPWGIVGGIILGAIIGFVQFFRITRQIISPTSSDFEKTSLFSDENNRKY